MGVFEFIIALVLISTIGKVLSGRRPPAIKGREHTRKLGAGEVEGIRESLDDLSGRVVRLEEERDFYKQLLDAPQRQRGISPPPAGGDAEPGA